ncbi:hypothetical protein [Kosakonia radicincitans]|uniref:hypothetical protein n=1 Tax=Kosakonia radicincitans TaxID=283686 RepID=UPI002368BF8F|nr:hypothetical protein [Kosakonia radicincitans]MDD7993778.1 hypothetical protein [Kosakonia radicincitans]
MKNMLTVWWKDLVRLLTRVYLPIGLTVIFAMVAVSYWEEYAIISTVIFLIVSFIVSDLIFKKKQKPH